MARATAQELHDGILKLGTKKPKIGGQCLTCGKAYAVAKSLVRHFVDDHWDGKIPKEYENQTQTQAVAASGLARFNFSNPLFKTAEMDSSTPESIQCVQGELRPHLLTKISAYELVVEDLKRQIREPKSPRAQEKSKCCSEQIIECFEQEILGLKMQQILEESKCHPAAEGELSSNKTTPCDLKTEFDDFTFKDLRLDDEILLQSDEGANFSALDMVSQTGTAWEDSLQTCFAKLTELKKKLECDLSIKSLQCAQLTKTIEGNANQIKTMTNLINNADERHCNDTKRLQVLQAEIDEANLRLQDDSKQIQSLQAELDEANLRLQDDSKQIQSLQAELDESNLRHQDDGKKIEMLQADIIAANERHVVDKKTIQNLMGTLSDQLRVFLSAGYDLHGLKQ